MWFSEPDIVGRTNFDLKSAGIESKERIDEVGTSTTVSLGYGARRD